MTPHWYLKPEVDFRTYLAPERRGRVNPGHRGVDPDKCPACQAPAIEIPLPPRLTVTQKKKGRQVYNPNREEIVLLAAEKVSNTSKGAVAISDLLLTVWKMAPNTFGLTGYKDQYPDASKLMNCIDAIQVKDWLRLKSSQVWSIGAGGWKRLYELNKMILKVTG